MLSLNICLINGKWDPPSGLLWLHRRPEWTQMAAPTDLQLKTQKRVLSTQRLLLETWGNCGQEFWVRPKSCRRKEAPGAWGVVSQIPKASLGLLRLGWKASGSCRVGACGAGLSCLWPVADLSPQSELQSVFLHLEPSGIQFPGKTWRKYFKGSPFGQLAWAKASGILPPHLFWKTPNPTCFFRPFIGSHTLKCCSIYCSESQTFSQQCSFQDFGPHPHPLFWRRCQKEN